ncbi:ATP-binding protein [Sphingobacterium sp. BS-2]|uniref:HD domain-containing protein n=1 Tax=Sphingobacterium sp. BS-2 TaxID=3377129 RepID=UPI0038FD25C7
MIEKVLNHELIKLLKSKINNSKNKDFSFISFLEEISNNISIEISQTNIDFPEYTPHDEINHIANLFDLAILVIDESSLNQMNEVELFCLIVSLYGHDWGMAVSNHEKDSILKKVKNSDYPFIDDEFSKIQEHIDNNNITNNELTQEIWADYIRKTHAERSGKRIEKYFNNKNKLLGKTISKICIGHWLDFKDLSKYSSNDSVLFQAVDTKSLSIYLRLIDLLDISNKRTPFALWKFINPKNKISEIEWQKHNSINSISVFKEHDQKILRIQGQTNSSEIYTTLIDLKKYIKNQLDECIKLMRGYKPNHKINFHSIDWRIETDGFEPLEYEFNFDREKVLKILTSAIYDSNPYIFIRELIQNSIDAINLKLSIYKTLGNSFTPSIEVNITQENLQQCITIKDNGIGMDEYVIENYFLKIGKSYFNSSEKIIIDSKIKQISQFGIGVLSCFMNAEKVEIETTIDPFIKESKNIEKISLTINNYNKFLTVKKSPASVKNTGTSIKIYLNDENSLKEKYILDFIKIYFNFLKNIKLNFNSEYFNGGFKLDSSDKSNYPIEKTVKPFQKTIFNKYFTTQSFAISNKVVEAYFNFIIPKDSNFDLQTLNTDNFSNFSIINYNDFSERSRISFNSNPKNNETDPYNQIGIINLLYCQGILIEDFQFGYTFIDNHYYPIGKYSLLKDFLNYQSIETTFKPNILINIKDKTNINISRKNIDFNGKYINKYIIKPLIAKIITSFSQPDSLKEKFLNYGRIITFYGVPYNLILEQINSLNEIIFPSIKNGDFIYTRFDEIEELIIIPESSNEEIKTSIFNNVFKNYNTNPSVIDLISKSDNYNVFPYFLYTQFRDNMPIALNNSFLFVNLLFESCFCLTSLNILEFNQVPIIVARKNNLFLSAIEKGKDEEDYLNIEEFFNEWIPEKIQIARLILSHNYDVLPLFVPFENHDNIIGYGFNIMNTNNDISKFLITILWEWNRINLGYNNNKIINEDEFEDLINTLPLVNDIAISIEDLETNINKLLQIAKLNNLNCHTNISKFTIEGNMFLLEDIKDPLGNIDFRPYQSYF